MSTVAPILYLWLQALGLHAHGADDHDDHVGHEDEVGLAEYTIVQLVACLGKIIFRSYNLSWIIDSTHTRYII